MYDLCMSLQLGDIQLDRCIQEELRKCYKVQREWGDNARFYERLKFDAPLERHAELRANIHWFPVPWGRPNPVITWTGDQEGIVHLDQLHASELEEGAILADRHAYCDSNRAHIVCISIHKELAELAKRITKLGLFRDNPTTFEEYAKLHQSVVYNLRYAKPLVPPLDPMVEFSQPFCGLEDLFDPDTNLPRNTRRNPANLKAVFEDGTTIAFHHHAEVFNGVESKIEEWQQSPLQINQLLPNMDPPTFQAILQYLYTNELPELTDHQCLLILQFARLTLNTRLETLVTSRVETYLLHATLPQNLPNQTPETLSSAASILYTYIFDKVARPGDQKWAEQITRLHALGY
jgi:hypothetical protein